MLGVNFMQAQLLRGFFLKKRTVLGVWILLALLATSKQLLKNSYNNYLIFKHTFWHALQQQNLYLPYPGQYGDQNHYGPFFSLLFAPFAILPDFLGALLWQLTNTIFLFWAISRLPLKNAKLIAVYWIIAHEALTAMFSFQINAGIAAMIILSLCFIREKKDFWAACMIMLGTFIKLYGIVGLAFFFFSRQKTTLIFSCAFWSIAFFVLPMAFFSPEFILQSYLDWFTSIQEKNLINTGSIFQDISVMGMARRISGNHTLPNLPFIAIGLLVFFLPYLRTSLYKNAGFQMMMLASVLLFLVLFSTGSESPTYIIAFTGVAIWYVLQEKPLKPLSLGLLIFALLLTSLSPSDLFPKMIREQYVRPFSLKALPCLLVWLAVIYDLLMSRFDRYSKATLMKEEELDTQPLQLVK